MSFGFAAVLVGAVVVASIFAAGTPVAFEAESGILAGGAAVTTATGQSGAGAVRFAATTATPAPGACPAATANTPGGSDGQGGCWPGAANTGVPAGTALSAYAGTTTISQSGTVIDGKDITQCLTVAAGAKNVIIRNSRFHGTGCYWFIVNNGANGLQIIDCEFDGQNGTSNDAAIAGEGYTLTRANIRGTGDGIKLGTGVTVQDSYIHDLAIDTARDTHNDGMQSLGSDNVVIKHNSIFIGDGGTSAIILSTGVASSMHNISITANLFAGGGYTVYGGHESGRDDANVVGGVSITNNRFSTVYNPNCGFYGPLTSVDPPSVTHTGNLWADGPKAGKSLD